MIPGTPSDMKTGRSIGASLDPATWVEEHADALYRYAKGRVGSPQEAEDLVQETFLAALRTLPRFEGRSTPRTWLVAILRRKILDHFRRSKSAGNVEPKSPREEVGPGRWFNATGAWIEAPARWAAPDLAMEGRELREVVEGCVDLLPSHLADAFMLREGEGLGAEDVCQVLNIGAANLRVRLHRARLLLRECLERTWFGGADESIHRSKTR